LTIYKPSLSCTLNDVFNIVRVRFRKNSFKSLAGLEKMRRKHRDSRTRQKGGADYQRLEELPTEPNWRIDHGTANEADRRHHCNGAYENLE
jgi:hypothetical protein